MITPLDIENKRFSKQVVNGYNVEDVDDFLDELVEDYGKNYKDLAEANEKIEKLTNDLEQYRNIEATLKNTLVVAQSTADEVKSVAKQQAEQIINDAKAQAEEILKQAKGNSERRLTEIEQQISIKKEEWKK